MVEAEDSMPRRNVERLLRDCNVPVATGPQRRLDLVVTGLGVARGLPLLCDVTCVSPVTGAGEARGGSLTIDGGAVQSAARRCHQVDYPEVARSQAARLYCLGSDAGEARHYNWSEVSRGSVLQDSHSAFAEVLRPDYSGGGGAY